MPSPSVLEHSNSLTHPLAPAALLAIARELARDASTWRALARHHPDERWFVRLAEHDAYDVWLIGWDSHQGVDLHDHGGSAGALYVVAGELVEHRSNPAGIGRPLRRVLREFDDRPMPPAHIHEIANESVTVAASIHVYSPPLAIMHHFEIEHEAELRMIRREVVGAQPSGT